MANIRLIRRRIKGVKNIAKITKAMEMIAASKMRRRRNMASPVVLTRKNYTGHF